MPADFPTDLKTKTAPTDLKTKVAALAKRPGTEGEGQAAKAALTRIRAKPVTEQRQRFTDRVVAGLSVPAAGYKLYRDVPGTGKRDVYVPGFGVRVMASGLRVFVLSYVVDGRDGRLKIGPFGPSPGLSVEAARDRARVEYLKIRGGADRAKEERDKRQAQTVAELCDAFLKDRAHKRPATVRMYTQIVNKEIKPALGRHKAALVEREDIRDLHRKISKRAPYQANRVLVTCKAIWNFGIEEKIVTENPCVGIDTNAEQKRKRYLKSDELARLHAALDAHKDECVADLFRFMLLTGARIGETLAARWNPDIDLEDKTWTKPGLTTKTHTDHEVKLNPEAVAILRKYKRDDGPVFPGMTYDSVKDDWEQLLNSAAITDLRRHDLRHTFGSYMLKATKNIMAVKESLGHTNVATTQRYMHVLDEDLRAATEATGAMLAGQRKRQN
jgi:integrase